MITINTDRGPAKIESWEDIAGRPHFVADLNPAEHELKEIIGRYALSDKVRCGLSNCHSPHEHGYIVVTKSGKETNIGKDCGKKYFGVDFQTLKNTFDRMVEENNNREAMWSFRFREDEVEARLTQLKSGEQGASALNRKLKQLTTPNAGFPIEIVRQLTKMAKDRTTAIMNGREATPEEIRLIEANEGRAVKRPHLIEETIGHLNGIDALFPENDLRNLLVIQVEEELGKFKTLKIDELDFLPLRHWSKWTKTVDDKFYLAEQAIAQALLLLRYGNLMQCSKLLATTEDKKRFDEAVKAIVKNIDTTE